MDEVHDAGGTELFLSNELPKLTERDLWLLRLAWVAAKSREYESVDDWIERKK